MDDVGTVGLVSFFAVFEESQLSGLAELDRTGVTYLRLLLRCQLSSPREDSGPLARLPSFM
mgnify:CR=1 FL=1